MANDNKTKTDEDEIDAALQFAKESCERFGVAVMTVSDGHFLFFTRARLQQVLDAHPDNPQVIIHVKRRTFGD